MSDETELAEEENLKKLGAVKSSYALIDLAASQIENRILLNDQVMNDNPASFTNIFLENFGRLGSQSFYEQMMYKNEMLPSTAIKLRSIVNKLSSDDIASIYAYPAHMTFVLGYNYENLVELLKKNGNYIIINKECKFSMEDQESFVLDNSIKIILTNPDTVNQNIYAIYIKDDSDGLVPDSSLSEVNNIYITSQIFYYNKTKVFGLFVNGRQMTRTENVINITTENPDFSVSFTDQLYGFELHYKENGSETYVKKTGYFEGNSNSNGFNFELDFDESVINFTFNRNPSYWSPSIGDEIKVIVYTTKGKSGNFTVPNMYDAYSQITFEYNQNRDDSHQDCLVFTDPYLSIKDNAATGGTDALSFDEIKAIAIQRGSNSSILTPGDLERKANKLGFATEKIRSDVRCLEYRASGVLQTSTDIISSRSSTITFDFNDIPVNSETSNRVLSPKMIYELNESTEKCEYKKDAEDYETYFDEFRNETKNQFMFPYHIRFTSNSVIQADIFNMNRNNDSYNLNFIYYHQKTSFESSIMNVLINRNVITEDIDSIPNKYGSKNASGYYDISFQVSTSDVVIANLLGDDENKIIKYKVTISDGTTEYLVNSYIDENDIDSENNLVTVHAYIRTDDAISNTEKIIARDYCIEPIPYLSNPIEYYFLPDKVSLKVYVLEKSEDSKNTSSYDNILTDGEKEDLYFVSTVYGVDSITLFEDYTDYFSFPTDLSISQKVYPTYDSDVYKVYDSDEYMYDDEGNIITEIKKISINTNSSTPTVIEVSNSKVLHKKGSYVYKDNINMTARQLAAAIAVLKDTTENELIKTYSFSDLANMIEFDIAKLSYEDLCIYLNKFLGLNYHTSVESGNTFILDENDNYITDTVLNNLQNELNSYRIKVVIHKAGDVNKDGAILKDETYTGIIKNVPMYDRIYSIGSGYQTILDTYDENISNIKTLKNLAPDGATICLGIKNTSGVGEYEVYDLDTSTWKSIDNIALSFDIGVKYSNTANTDEDANNEIIIETIRDFINNFDDISFGINTIFEEVKTKIPSIEYMILYKINQYSPAEVQSIRKADGASIVSDKLSVKQVVDIDNTDLSTSTVTFKPDITIRTIS